MRKRIGLLLMALMVALFPTAHVFAEEYVEETEIYMNPLYGEEIIIEQELVDADNAVSCSSWDEVVSVVRKTMKARQSSVVLNYTSSEQLAVTWLKQLLADVMSETPNSDEGDYLECHFGGCKSSRRTSQANGMYVSQITLTFTYYTTSEQEAVVTKQVNNLLNSFKFTSSTSDYDKVKKIYDWVCSNVDYDYTNLENSEYKLKFTAYAALMNRTAVCQGFAALCYRMFEEAGIDARVITGTSSGERHAWLIVNLDGLYYNLDPAWDSSRSTYKYFLNTEAQFTNHKRAAEFSTDTFYQQYPMGTEDYLYIQSVAPIRTFVSRLYDTCLNRKPDTAGLNDWTNQLKNGTLTGVSAASGIVFSQEFKNRNLSNEAYVETLYQAFMGRSSDPSGKSYWMDKLSSGMSREEVFNGFAMSAEFGKICAQYGIVQGSPIDVPIQEFVPGNKYESAEPNGNVTGFVQRLYKICLNREADASGLADWTGQLTNHTNSGRGVAYGFIFSQEFINKNHNNEDYVEYLYTAFMDRASDAAGKADWLNRMSSMGWSREQVFDGFVGSQEFTNICEDYGILRD